MAELKYTFPSDKEFLLTDSIIEKKIPETTSVEFPPPLELSKECPKCMLPPSNSYYRMILTLLIIISSTTSIITLPWYLNTLHTHGDVYSGVFITTLFVFLINVIVLFVYKLKLKDSNFQCPFNIRQCVKIGILLGISFLLIFYARDSNRVLCHLQDPLTAAMLPMTIAGHYLLGIKGDSARKLFCLAAVIIGLFICIDFQIWDEFTCLGHPLPAVAVWKMKWSATENAIWTIVYLAGLLFFSLFLALLENAIKGKKPKCMVSTINIGSINSISSQSENSGEDMNEILIQCHSVNSENIFTRLTQHEVLEKEQVLLAVVWMKLFSFLTVLACAWTNFSFLGKATSMEDFMINLHNNLLCHFSSSPDCGNHLVAEWIFILSSMVLILSIAFFINYSGTYSTPYLATMITFSLPLSTFFWSCFKIDNGLVWNPSFTGEAGFAIVGFPIMVIASACYGYYASKENRFV